MERPCFADRRLRRMRSLSAAAAFLAEFEFAFELLDLHLEANNPGHEAVFVCLGQLPEIVSRLIAFEFTDEPGQQVVK